MYLIQQGIYYTGYGRTLHGEIDEYNIYITFSTDETIISQYDTSGTISSLG